MSHTVQVRPTAEQDIWTAVGWYDAHGQGERLLDEVATAMARIAENPELYRTVHGPVRRAPLRVFPYFLWYVIDEASTAVQVLAMTHHRRDPDAVRPQLQ